jgi:hypothetical protein
MPPSPANVGRNGETMKKATKIEIEKNQKHVRSIVISIAWVRNRTRGNNPNATAEVAYHDGTFERRSGFRASGCGYDKESTVIAQIFDDFLKYKLWELTPEQREKSPYGIVTGDYTYYSGGIGTSCYHKIAEFIGGKFEHLASGKTFDAFRYSEPIS